MMPLCDYVYVSDQMKLWMMKLCENSLIQVIRKEYVILKFKNKPSRLQTSIDMGSTIFLNFSNSGFKTIFQPMCFEYVVGFSKNNMKIFIWIVKISEIWPTNWYFETCESASKPSNLNHQALDSMIFIILRERKFYKNNFLHFNHFLPGICCVLPQNSCVLTQYVTNLLCWCFKSP